MVSTNSDAVDSTSADGIGKVSGRDGTLEKANDSYVLLRNSNANTRLTAQHYLWRQLLGFLVHPDIPIKGGDVKVADVATGNGIWLHDLARENPSITELHGFDISLDQVGPKPWLPANIHMHTWNIFEKPPAQFVGYFDVVHVRLLTVVIQNDDPRPVLANLTKLLKPGGYLQWGEVDPIGCSVQALPGVSGENIEKIWYQLVGRDTWTSCMTRILDENGYTGSRLHTYTDGLDRARIWNEIYVSTWKEFAEKALQTPDESSRLEQKAVDEVRRGAAIMVPKLVWVAKKL
ncbi:uncharacterized protein B0T15DRAFT_397103 [Chaetomium strumarium]|uniref:Methyltransferase type 12 domain-containing protein n=1 Tax=Chaetomium strumarium TaxID=1170767 RepID=A0AAJ0M1L1_9PEZI|nr:hypothetical protein B0T15DRAFT_397103 [Chaetomium strumarium]